MLNCPTYSINEIDMAMFEGAAVLKRPPGNNGGAKRRYLNVICSFDIETTYFEEIGQSAMYIWMLSWNNEFLVYGRTWNQFIKLMTGLEKLYEKSSAYIPIYVHNLSYEFQFLSGIYDFAPWQVFAVKSRKILRCEMGRCFEFRCSYLQTNMSLEEFTNKMGVTRKAVGKLDYSIRRTPQTPLSADELEYCLTDVYCLIEAIRKEMEIDDDTIYTIPYTSTGYVRRLVRTSVYQSAQRAEIRALLQDIRIYEMEREAFAGGVTIANRFYAGRIIENVKSADRSSSYPDVQCNDKFPMTQFEIVGYLEADEIYAILDKRRKALLMRVSFTNLRLRDPYDGAPSISRSHCRNVRGSVESNGRVIECEYFETTITDVDFSIIDRHYEWDDVCFFEVAVALYGKLPDCVTDPIKFLYRRKTELKDIEGMTVYYVKDKNLLNAVFGMSAQDPVKQDIIYQNNTFSEGNVSEEKLLDAYNKKAFMPYSWGVWTTALARLALYEGIELAGDGFVYCDTDSVKYVGDIDWESYNAQRRDSSIKNGAFGNDKHGVSHYMGVYEMERTYDRFITLGAKRYAYEIDGKIGLTISGVRKSASSPEEITGAQELAKHGGLEAFREGFVFNESGGLEAVYNDDVKPYVYDSPEGPITIVKNVALRPSTYTIDLGDFGQIIDKCAAIWQHYELDKSLD